MILNSLGFMYYVYVLLSKTDGKFYTGSTENLKSRFEQHRRGCVVSTKERRPLELIYCLASERSGKAKLLHFRASAGNKGFNILYYEACLEKCVALYREKYLKTFHGKLFLRNRPKSYLTG